MMWKVVLGSASGQESRTFPRDVRDRAALEKPKHARVLIVDDEPSICKALSMALSRAGYDVIAAQSGESALAIIRNEHVDIMLIDLRIPDMRGDVIFEVAASQHEHLKYQTVFMTGDITERAQSLIDACKCPSLPKPFDLREMMDAIEPFTPRARDAAG